MGLASAQDTPKAQIQKSTPQLGADRTGERGGTPHSPTPNNFLDTIRKPSVGAGIKEHERVLRDAAAAVSDLTPITRCRLLMI
jgi:hypothetical protein